MGVRARVGGLWEVALSTSDTLRHLRVTSVRSKVALSFDAHSRHGATNAGQKGALDTRLGGNDQISRTAGCPSTAPPEIREDERSSDGTGLATRISCKQYPTPPTNQEAQMRKLASPSGRQRH